ncbi:MAG: LAGLIDADG family homing endonuclease [Solirubrobacteraceae bacterium]
MSTAHRELRYRPLPVLRAENAPVLIHPDDRKYGALLVGSMGSGKCIGPDDLVLLAGRLIRAEDAWKHYATEATFDGEGWWSEPLEHPQTCAVDAMGRITRAPVTRLYRQRVHERLRRVRFSDGSELTITAAHRLRGPDGWAADLVEGSVVCAPRFLTWCGRTVDLELVELLAWQIAEGCETGGAKKSARGSSYVTISQADVRVLERLRELALNVGERYGLRMNQPRVYPETRAPMLKIESAEWRDFLARNGYRWGQKSCGKALPDFVMQGDLNAARVFLRAYADAEGSVQVQKRTIEMMTASRLLGDQVRILLRRFGIVATVRTKRAHATNGGGIERDYRRLSIRGESLRLFLDEIGFGYRHKHDQLTQMVAATQIRSHLTGVCSQDVLSEIKTLGVPFSWIAVQIRLTMPRVSHAEALKLAERIRDAARRLDAGDYLSPRARGVYASAAHKAVLAALDTGRLRDLAAKLERRAAAEVVYLTVERIKEVDHDGWVYDFEVPEHHNYVAGGVLAHNTAALLRLYANDLLDNNTAIIILDPKSELSRLCLALTPPDCGKRVWFLDLGRPAFGMSPLRLSGDGALPIQASAVAENIVAALLDINENQIFQSSRRYLYHAVIGAIALAERQQRRAKFEDVYSLLLPTKQDFRAAVAEACADQPDLDQTAEFFRSELPEDLKMATSAVAQRLDAPRNKVAGLTGVPPLRRFFNHPTDISLREILEARDVLIVDANMGAIGEENSKACLHFLLRMLHTQMQRQVHLPETDRPRVPLLIDEAHYVAGAENVVDQIATHRRGGMEAAFGLQYFAQLGSGSQHEQKIRKGVLNLLQSRFLFRMGDAQDAEEATRIAMAVYSTMIRDDPDSRARLRVTPEQALNFPNHHCLASWIAIGSRIPSFMGQTYPFPAHSQAWAEHHLQAMAERVAPYPEQLGSTLDRSAPHDGSDAHDAPAPGNGKTSRRRPRAASVNEPADSATPTEPEPTAPAAKHEVRVDFEAPPEAPNLADSPVRRVVGRRVPGTWGEDSERPAPDSLRELVFLDRVNEIGPAGQLDGVAKLPRLYEEDYAVLAFLDRGGLAPRSLIARAVFPKRAGTAVYDRLTKLHRHGLIARHSTGLREHTRSDGKPPLLYSLTRRGLEVAQTRTPTPAISPRRDWKPIDQARAARLAHDLHALGWAVELHHTVGTLATDHWRTPRYATGRYPVPQVGSGQRRHPITLNEIPVPDGQAIIDVSLKTFHEVKPDLSLELRIESIKLTFDLLVELDLTARASYNHDKFLAYDAFLCGWSAAHSRYQTQGTRPAVLFVCPDAHAALACANEADDTLTGRIGVMGTPPEHWYYAGRDHVYFATEADVHHGDLRALALPPLPPGLRERLTGQRELELAQVELLAERTVQADRDHRPSR